MSAFNPNTFLSQETTEALQDKFTPIPAGEYACVIDDVIATTAKTDNGEKPILSVTFSLIGDTANEVRKALGYRPDQKVTVKQDYWLDLNESGGFDIGPNKNVKLGMLRDILGQNQPGQPWAPLMMKGQGPVSVQVGVGVSKKDGVTEYNTVNRVGKHFG